MSSGIILSGSCRAILFDLDGVITDTRSAHKFAWKQTLDRLLILQENTKFETFLDFSDNDYAKYVDGRPRLDGITTFLDSRNIEIPYGQIGDNSLKTVHGVAAIKNDVYTATLEKRGVHVFRDAVTFLRQLKQSDLKLGLVTSSKNASLVLEAANLSETFDVIIDGNSVEQRAIKAKPRADGFIEAARCLEVDFSTCLVLEDSFETLRLVSLENPYEAIGIDRTPNMRNAVHFAPLTVVPKLTDIRLDKMIENQ